MKIGNSIFEVVNKDGKLFVKHTFNGEHFRDEDMMMIYGLSSKPFVKILGTKMYLPEEFVKELRGYSIMDWQNFKKTKFAIKCTEEKEKFFSDCAEHGIYNFMGERAFLRDFFVCRLCYKDQFSEGRYELMSCEEWQIKENGLFGKYGLGVKTYDKTIL